MCFKIKTTICLGMQVCESRFLSPFPDEPPLERVKRPGSKRGVTN